MWREKRWLQGILDPPSYYNSIMLGIYSGLQQKRLKGQDTNMQIMLMNMNELVSKSVSGGTKVVGSNKLGLK